MGNNNIFERDLYLRKIHTGEIQGPLTGNIFEDKTWVSNFQNIEEANFNIYETLYNTYRNFALRHLDETAVYIQKTSKTYTHRDLLELIDITSAALNEVGIKENSRVGLFLNSSIEDSVFLLALNKIGALSKWFDAFKNPQEIVMSLQESTYDLLIVDEALLPLEKAVNSEGIQVIIANTKEKCDNAKYTDFDSFCQIGIGKSVKAVSFDEKRPTVIINSSGTTGPSKPIIHCDRSINAAAQKIMYTDYPIGRNNVMMKMVPSQIGLGLVTSMYSGLISGTQVAFVSGNSIEEMGMNMISFVKGFPNYRDENYLPKDAKLNIFTAPIQIRVLIKSDLITDLSFIGSIMIGGSKVSKKELNELTEIGREKGLKVPICVGYGQNELAGGASYNYNSKNKNGSAGFPAIGTDIQIVNPSTFSLLRANQEGLILERSNSEFLYYDKMEKRTKEARVKMPDGLDWFNTYDLGYMDQEGFIFITGRLGRTATRFDSKVSLDTVEEKIKELSFVEDCAAICPTFGGSMEEIISFIVASENNEEKIASMIQSANILSLFEMPNRFIVLEQLPHLSSGKPNYELLKKQYQEMEQTKQQTRTLKNKEC